MEARAAQSMVNNGEESLQVKIYFYMLSLQHPIFQPCMHDSGVNECLHSGKGKWENYMQPN